MKFAYTATNNEGKTSEGIAEAVDRASLVASLQKQGLKPVVIKLAGTDGGKKKHAGKVKLKDLVVFTRQLSTMITAGVPLTRSLSTMQSQSENKYFKEVIATITRDIEGGMSLGDSFAKYPNIFSAPLFQVRTCP